MSSMQDLFWRWIRCTAWAVLALGWTPAALAQNPGTAASAAMAVRRYVVPDVVGHELTEAMALLRKAGFSPQSEVHESADTRQVVTATAPPAGRAYAVANQPVVVSASVEYLMPDLHGLTCATAMSRMREIHHALAGCSVGTPTGQVAAGLIQRQQPPAHQPLTSNDARAWTEPEGISVPGVVNLRASDADAVLRKVGLRARFSTSPTPWHWVQTQDPAAGRKVAAGSEISVGLIARYTVPPLAGLTCAQANGALRQAGLAAPACLPETQAASGAPGRIDRQFPAAGQVVSTPTGIQVWVTPALVQVPDLVGKQEAQASAMLNSSHLVGAASGPPAASGRTVLTQAPVAGAQVQPQSTVHFNLALTVPSLGGLTCTQAQARGREFGFADVRCTEEKVQAQALDRVFRQDPVEHTSLTASKPLQVWIAQGIRVPQVVGLTPAAARSALAQVQLRPVLDASDGDRQVATQAPAADTQVSPGATVSLTTRRMTRVPEVDRLSLADAIRALEARELGHAQDAAQDEAMRHVVEQSPTPDAHVPVGTVVRLRTQLYVVVPDVRNQPLSVAREILLKARLKAQAEPGDRPEQRIVREQQPAADRSVAPGTIVALVAALQVQVPNLAGLSCEAARQTLQALALREGTCAPGNRIPTFLGEPKVSSQTPAPGTTVDEDRLVDLEAKAPLTPLVTLTGALLGGTWLAWARIGGHRPFRRRVATSPAVASIGLRIEPDAVPRVAARMAIAADAAHRQFIDSDLHWRVEGDEVQAFARGNDLVAGESHAHR